MVYKSISITKYKHRKKFKIGYFTQECLSVLFSITISFVFIIFCCSNVHKDSNEIKSVDPPKIEQQTPLPKSVSQQQNKTIKQDNETPKDTQPKANPKQIKFAEPIPAWSQNITSHFGDLEDRNRAHKGLDIAMPSGTPIKAVLDGTITISEENSPSYGKYIEITHNDTLKTRYAHCSELKVKNGDKVKQGDIIALVGSTGDSTGPHLHLEVIKNNIKVDPEQYLK